MNKELIDLIKVYRSRGWAVIPAAYRSKIPMMKWKLYQHRHPTLEELNGWFSQGNLNVCIVCGAISGNLAVIDFDRPGPIWEKLESCLPYVKTSKGYHVYVTTPEPVGNFRFSEGDIRGEGGIVVVPPSVHPSGGVYQWMTPIGSVYVDDLSDYGIIPIKVDMRVDSDDWDSARNIKLTSLAGAMRSKGAPSSVILAALREMNTLIPEPLPEQELMTISNSVAKYNPCLK